MNVSITRPMIRIAAVLGVSAALGLGTLGTSFAAGDTGLTITGGTLSASGSIGFSNFSAVTLNGSQRTTTATWSLPNVTDARGTGAGWKYTLSLTPFAEYAAGAYMASGKTLAASSLQVTTAPVVAQVDTSSSPANTVASVPASTALDTGSAVTLLSAAVDGGMGSYSASDMTAQLTIPASAYAKSYKSDATISLDTTP